ncbi:hypothetical protein [Spirosoma areae]
MTHPSTYSLLFFTLLLSCGGCKKQDDPGISVQANSCLIATQTTKELVSPSQQSKLDPETVMIDGESFQVSTTKKSVYTYDAKGRILTEYNQYAGNKADSIYYQYSPMAVSIRTVDLITTPKLSKTSEVTLNNQGLAEKQGSIQATYDKDGYLVTLKGEYLTNIINNGNIIESLLIDHDAGPSHTYKYEYDLNKPGLPPVQAFYGKESRNLLIKYAVENSRYKGIYPSVYTGTYAYTFDEKSRVKRQIFRGKDGEIVGYIYGGDKVQINDFTYTCP